MMGASEIEDNLDRIKTAVMRKIPFVASLLRNARFVVTKIPSGAAGVGPDGWIYLDEDEFPKLSFREQAFALAHEVLHAVNGHAKRAKNREDKLKWNFATDSIVNNLLGELMRPPDWTITPRTIVNTVGKNGVKLGEIASLEDVEKMSDFELYDLLEENYGYATTKAMEGKGEKAPFNSLPQVVPENPMYSDGGGDLTDEERDGKVIQNGAGFNDSSDPNERKEGWERAVARAATQQRLAGTVPAGLKRWVDDLLRPDINVRSLIKQQIRNGLGTLVVNDWYREGRRIPDLPASKTLTTPTIWNIIDTSGSVTEGDLKLELGAVYEFASVANIRVIPWDAEAYEVLEANAKSQVMTRIARRLEGGGGTVILPVLERLASEMKPRDIIVCLTDGGIFDKNEEETRKQARLVARKSSVAFVCSIGEEVDFEGWKFLKIKGR